VRARELGVKPCHIVYDSIGVGADFGNRLRQAGIVGAHGYVGSHSGGEKFSNLRAVAHWLLRRRIDPHRQIYQRSDAGARSVLVPQKPFAIPQHLLQRYRAELQGLRYELDPAGRIQLEAKEVFIKRLKHSPNFVDALAMTFAFPNT
jgi:hypothetical protein